MKQLSIAILGAGAAGMYCGSCLRDNTLARALIRAGHKAVLVPLYTPIRTDEQNAAIGKVFYGGVNSWLQYAMPLFRHTPRFLDWLFDRPWLLKLAGTYGAQTPPAKLGPFVLSILEGEHGPQLKELNRLVRFLRDQIAPQIVTLPNLMFMGVARALRDELGCRVICELTGEDIFLDAMAEPYRTRARDAIRARVDGVAGFVATSGYYAGRMADYLEVPADRIDVVYPGISAEHWQGGGASGNGRGPTVGFLARICPEKGLHRLIEAMAALRRLPGMGNVTVKAAGYLGPGHRNYYEQVLRQIADAGLATAFTYAGELDFAGKLAFLDSIDVFCVPTDYAEAKGIYVLEALARGVPAVQPAHGSFPELIEKTGGGLLVRPGDAQAMATAIAELLSDPARRMALGAAGKQAVITHFTDDAMAQRMLGVFARAMAGKVGSAGASLTPQQPVR